MSKLLVKENYQRLFGKVCEARSFFYTCLYPRHCNLNLECFCLYVQLLMTPMRRSNCSVPIPPRVPREHYIILLYSNQNIFETNGIIQKNEKKIEVQSFSFLLEGLSNRSNSFPVYVCSSDIAQQVNNTVRRRLTWNVVAENCIRDFEHIKPQS